MIVPAGLGLGEDGCGRVWTRLDKGGQVCMGQTSHAGMVKNLSYLSSNSPNQIALKMDCGDHDIFRIRPFVFGS